MIIGNGLVAKELGRIDDENVLYFASGVSNSNETNNKEFEREQILLLNTINNNKDKKIVYLSTCSIYDNSKKDSLYVKHKLSMESIVVNNSKNYLIFRISNIIGKGGNKNTLVNFIVDSINNEREIIIFTNATRNLIDIYDTVNIIKCNINRNKEIINVAYIESVSIEYLVKIVEDFLGKKAKKSFKPCGDRYEINSKESLDYFNANKIFNTDIYYKQILKKYF